MTSILSELTSRRLHPALYASNNPNLRAKTSAVRTSAHQSNFQFPPAINLPLSSLRTAPAVPLSRSWPNASVIYKTPRQAAGPRKHRIHHRATAISAAHPTQWPTTACHDPINNFFEREQVTVHTSAYLSDQVRTRFRRYRGPMAAASVTYIWWKIARGRVWIFGLKCSIQCRDQIVPSCDAIIIFLISHWNWS